MHPLWQDAVTKAFELPEVYVLFDYSCFVLQESTDCTIATSGPLFTALAGLYHKHN